MKWNSVTWYSKIAALILFVGIIPILGFYVGMQYQITRHMLIEAALAQKQPTLLPPFNP